MGSAEELCQALRCCSDLELRLVSSNSHHKQALHSAFSVSSAHAEPSVAVWRLQCYFQWKLKKLKSKLIRQILTLSQNCAAAAEQTFEPGQTGSERKEYQKGLQHGSI